MARSKFGEVRIRFVPKPVENGADRPASAAALDDVRPDAPTAMGSSRQGASSSRLISFRAVPVLHPISARNCISSVDLPALTWSSRMRLTAISKRRKVSRKVENYAP